MKNELDRHRPVEEYERDHVKETEEIARRYRLQSDPSFNFWVTIAWGAYIVALLAVIWWFA